MEITFSKVSWIGVTSWRNHMETKALCKYFLHGACSRGSQCLYAHDLNAKADNVCKYYLSGSCMYGKSCRYDHVKPNKISKPVIDTEKKLSPLKLVPLKKKKKEEKADIKDGWHNAPEFVPGRKCHPIAVSEEKSPVNGLYAEIASLNMESEQALVFDESGTTYDGDSINLLCPFAAIRDCPYGDSCEYLHGDLCDMCGCLCLHPTNEQQREDHRRECLASHELEMEIAFAVQRSSGVSCSICLDVVKEKADITERMFGILENCNHPFCLSCIRKWRLSSNVEKTVVRACPICRVTSWFVTPSDFWVEDETDKNKLISNYQDHLKTKLCRNFDKGRGTCPFGTSCFYRHELADGTIDNSKPDIRHLEDGDGQSSVLKTPRLNEFIAARDT